jgi:thioredoxin-related protein
MKRMLILTMVAVTLQLHAQELKNFKLENVLNGQQISPESFPSCSGLVIIFTSNACPYDEYYRTRINTMAKTYSDKVPVLLVNAHSEEAESRDQMIARGKQLNLATPYLADKNQTLMMALNAKKSPEAFLLKNNGGTFTVIYRGAIDDNAQVEADVRHAYLKDAIDIMLANQSVATPEVRPVGCNLKKKT